MLQTQEHAEDFRHRAVQAPSDLAHRHPFRSDGEQFKDIQSLFQGWCRIISFCLCGLTVAVRGVADRISDKVTKGL